MKVIQVIESKEFGGRQSPWPKPTEVVYYNGDDHVEALSALMTAAADKGSQYVSILSARIEF